MYQRIRHRKVPHVQPNLAIQLSLLQNHILIENVKMGVAVKSIWTFCQQIYHCFFKKFTNIFLSHLTFVNTGCVWCHFARFYYTLVFCKFNFDLSISKIIVSYNIEISWIPIHLYNCCQWIDVNSTILENQKQKKNSNPSLDF